MEKKKNPNISVSPIDKKGVVIGTTSQDLKYFYENDPGETITDSQQWLPYVPEYTINSDGLNQSSDYSAENQSGNFRIMTIGDSFTFGAFLNTADNYPEQLEQKLSAACKKEKIEIINLGVRGYDIQYTAERFIRRGIKYNPDLVIWLLNSWNYTKVNELVIQRANEINDEATRSGKLNEIIKKRGRYFAWNEAIDEELQKLGKEQLLNMQLQFFKNFREMYKGKLIVLYFPDQLNAQSSQTGFNEFMEKIKNYDSSIKVIPTVPYNSLETLKVDPHPNKKDYAVIVEKLYKYLIDKEEVPCN